MRRSSGRALGFTQGKNRMGAWAFKSLPFTLTGTDPCKSSIVVPLQRTLRRLVLLSSATLNTRAPDAQLRAPARAFVKGPAFFTDATAQRSVNRPEIDRQADRCASCGPPSLEGKEEQNELLTGSFGTSSWMRGRLRRYAGRARAVGLAS